MFKLFKRIKEVNATKEAARLQEVNIRLAHERAEHERICAENVTKREAAQAAALKASGEKWKQRFREECERQGKQVPACMK
ncbi:hypothetical protein [Paenibacillus illinoisensis]|uniref:Uncharacterized protein n=1 Tax=Paenibacillus illinoisensis TaxID=59845 RepID=A0A2W0C7B3_9BACL|nr:hypothetical protein [Paenibacillus illinoisensis]PYY28326.1 hypothetical protein PIL02S_03477 [Paenibacillus illinoisensis]